MVMNYLELSPGFSQFDRDNMDRWMTAAYINQANAVLAMIEKSRGAVARRRHFTPPISTPHRP
jgi:hypothetical protein